MGFINQGSQFITFDFKHKAKGSDFNKLNRTVIRPGIYSGLKATYVGNNVFMSIGTCVFNCAYGVEDNLQVKVNFNSVYDYGVVNPTTLGQNEVLYLEYEYGEVTENYVDFKHTSYNSFDFDNENLIIIGEIVYNGSYNISSISYTNRSFGFNNADLDYAIPDNTRYYNIEDETKFFEIDGRNLSSGTRKIVLPNFSENEGNLLISTATNTVDILHNLTVSGTSNLRNTTIEGVGLINLSGTANFTSVNINEGTTIIQSNGDANFRNLIVSQDMTLGGNISIEGFLNTAETTNYYFLNIISGTTHTANFDNSDIVFVTLQSVSASTITISVPPLDIGKWRHLYVYVKSNGNYSFNSTTTQGNTIFWKSTTNGVPGTQPSWSASNTLDGHHFVFDGTRLYHITTFGYVITGEVAPTNLNYTPNTFDLFTFNSYNISPTLSGTSPFIFTAQTTLPTGVSLTANTGILSTTSNSRTESSNATNYTIRATNNISFTERIVSIRFSHNISNLTRGFYSFVPFTGANTVLVGGFQKYNSNYFYPYPAMGSLTSEKFKDTTIELIRWTGTSQNNGGRLDFAVPGDYRTTSWTSLTIGNLNNVGGTLTFLKSSLSQIGYTDPATESYDVGSYYVYGGGDAINARKGTRFEWSIDQNTFTILQSSTSPYSIRII